MRFSDLKPGDTLVIGPLSLYAGGSPSTIIKMVLSILKDDLSNHIEITWYYFTSRREGRIRHSHYNWSDTLISSQGGTICKLLSSVT